MLLAAPLALLLAAAPALDDGRGAVAEVSAEGRGSVGSTPEQAQSRRPFARFRGGLGAGALFGLANYSPAFGVGFTADGGVLLNDRLALFLHGELGTIVLTLVGSAGLVGEYAFTDHWSAGLGVAFTAWAPLLFGSGGLFYGLTFPLRLNWAPQGRSTHQTRRSGLLIGLQVAPGVSLMPTDFFQLRAPLPPEPAFAATVSIGYALW